MQLSEEEKPTVIVKKCHWCGRDLFEEDIKEKGNARGYGYYIDCICGKENVIKEVDLCN